MQSLTIAFPVLPGKAPDIRRFFDEEKDEYRKCLRRLRVLRETLDLQATDRDGGIIIVHLEADDPLRVLAQFRDSQDPFDIKCKGHFKLGTGRELSQPAFIAAMIPATVPERIFEWHGDVV